MSRRFARDLERPVFLAFESDEDVAPQIPFSSLAKVLRRSDSPNVIVEYEPDEPAMRVQVDMLTQLAQFLTANFGD